MTAEATSDQKFAVESTDVIGMAPSLSWRRVWPFVLMSLFCAQASAGPEREKPAVTFHADVNEVQLTFSATDQNDHGVATLRAADVVVVDRDIVVREFQNFARRDWTRLQIAVLADNSESVAPRFRQELANLVEVISQTDGIPEEDLSLFAFHDSEPSLICAGDCRAAQAAERVPAMSAGKVTPLFDSITFAADFVAQHNDVHAKKVLIVFSDGIDTISRNSLGDAIEAGLRADVEIYAVDFGSSVTEGSAVLTRLTTATGGRYFPPNTDPIHVVNGILDGLHASYEITYRLPTRYPGFHTIRLVPSHSLNLQFRSRSGYYYPSEFR